jgi:hypothetical protein
LDETSPTLITCMTLYMLLGREIVGAERDPEKDFLAWLG